MIPVKRLLSATKKWRNPLIFVFFLFFSPFLTNNNVFCADRERLLDDYGNGLSVNWQTKTFSGIPPTDYKVIQEDGQACIQATSNAGASGLLYKIDYDPKDYPILSWRWKVGNILARGDARTKAGDDYAARIYVVFPSFFFWKTRAINYIWANKLPKGSVLPNAYTSNDIMIAVESGPGKTGQWLTERRNVYEDFKRLFGEEPPRVGAIALMTDTDNTGGSATACYGPISLRAASGDGSP